MGRESALCIIVQRKLGIDLWKYMTIRQVIRYVKNLTYTHSSSTFT